MEARADAASFSKGMIYAAAYNDDELIEERISEHEVGGCGVCLAPKEILKLGHSIDWKRDIWFDFVVKKENKQGLEDDIEMLLVQW